MLKCNKNNYKSTKRLIIIKSTDISLDRQASSASVISQVHTLATFSDVYRFIDDVDMKWTQSDEELQNFLSRANNLHPSIKFTHEISNTTISFLDTSNSLSEGVLSTDLYSKPTDTNQYLLPSSCHPPHVTKSIPYSQALRIRRICSTDKSLKNDWVNLKII